MEIKRDGYLRKVVSRKHNRMIKVITGMRRSGKSYLLFTLFYNHLKSEGVDDRHVIKVDLEDRRFTEFSGSMQSVIPAVFWRANGC